MARFKLFIGNKCFSSWSLRPWIGMRHFGIPFEEGFVRLRTPETAANLAAVSPTGQVPVLLDEGKVIWETLAILEYLAELFPEKAWWPEDRDGRAQARSVATEMHSGFRALRYAWPMNLRRLRGPKALDGEADGDRRRVETVWRECLARHGGPLLFGPDFTIADAMYAPMVTRFSTYGGDLAPETAAYVEAVLALPAMREWYEGAAAETWPEPGADE
jgi:glutathione S-transferase